MKYIYVQVQRCTLFVRGISMCWNKNVRYNSNGKDVGKALWSLFPAISNGAGFHHWTYIFHRSCTIKRNYLSMVGNKKGFMLALSPTHIHIFSFILSAKFQVIANVNTIRPLNGFEHKIHASQILIQIICCLHNTFDLKYLIGCDEAVASMRRHYHICVDYFVKKIRWRNRIILVLIN